MAVCDVEKIDSVNVPLGRSSFGICNDNDGNVYIFGGIHKHGYDLLNDFWRYNGMLCEYILLYLILFCVVLK